MSAARTAKPMVPDYVSDLVKTGSTDLARNHMDIFAHQLLEAAPELFQQALDIAKQDAAFRADVFTKLSREVHDAIKANDAMSQKVLDDASANNELIRKMIGRFLEDGQISSAEFELLVADLRYYHNDMKETRRMAQAEREKMLRAEKEAAELAAKKNKIEGYVAGGISGFLIGIGIGITWLSGRHK